MTHLALTLLESVDLNGPAGLWLFLSIGAIAMFGIFLPIGGWSENRRKEREAYYRAEMIRRIAESSGEGAKAAMELLREDARLQQLRKIEGLKMGGLINLCVGIALIIFMPVMLGGWHGPALGGLIPAFLGLAMLIYVFFMVKPVE